MDCQDQSDELGCNYTTVNNEKEANKYTVGCYPSDIRCEGSSMCVRPWRVCDFSRDCPGEEDEKVNNTLKNKIEFCDYEAKFYSGVVGVRSCVTVWFVGLFVWLVLNI